MHAEAVTNKESSRSSGERALWRRCALLRLRIVEEDLLTMEYCLAEEDSRSDETCEVEKAHVGEGKHVVEQADSIATDVLEMPGRMERAQAPSPDALRPPRESRMAPQMGGKTLGLFEAPRWASKYVELA